MDYRDIAEKIYSLVGKKNNIVSFTHCMTRLRLKLNDYDKADTDAMKKINGVMGINLNEDELQIILGPGRADNVYSEFAGIMENTDSVPSDKCGISDCADKRDWNERCNRCNN